MVSLKFLLVILRYLKKVYTVVTNVIILILSLHILHQNHHKF